MGSNIVSTEEEKLLSVRKSLHSTAKGWMYNADIDNNGDFVHFYFEADYNGQSVIFDASICSLILQYNSLLIEESDKALKKVYPDYKGWDLFEEPDEAIETERMIVIEEIEAEGRVKVQEQLELTEETEGIILLDVYLNQMDITDEVVDKFVKEYKQGVFKLDKTLYTFSLEEDEA